jgi:glycosyltransferase involved in cell wall biosynthesis
MNNLPISLIILTFNEEKNIRACLQSVVGRVNQIFVVDSFSTDNTLAICQEFNIPVIQNKFENYSIQRNWAFKNLEITNTWIMNIDADHRVSEDFWADLNQKFKVGIKANINGYMAPRRTMFLDTFVKYGGHYPIYQGVVFRKGFGQCEEKEYDQHFVIDGDTEIVKGDIIDIITESLSVFTLRHDKWSTLEANDAIALKNDIAKKLVKADKNGNPMEQRRYQRMKYYSYPLFLRVFIYFFYRFIIRGGFRDGKIGMIFHFLQGFWFRFLVDAKIYEMQKNQKD